MKRWILTVLAPTLMLLAAPAAKATWLGLSDGDHLINLSCTQSSVIACPSVTSGTVTVAGNDITAMDFTIDGVNFSGDASESLFSNVLVDYDSATVSTFAPYRFLSLRLITAGQIGPFGAGDHWWVYCSHAGNDNTCAPNTTGLWTATLLNRVPEPQTGLLLVLGLAVVGWVRRRRY